VTGKSKIPPAPSPWDDVGWFPHPPLKRSPCHDDALWSAIADGVLCATCAKCGEFIHRINVVTGQNEITARALAALIARRLFTGGTGHHAARLVLMEGVVGKERELGGWCEGAVRDVIEDSIRPLATGKRKS
jgi:hypothetical protein